MSSKMNPGPFDCIGAALPDEPYFVLLARDTTAPGLIRAWADKRRSDLLALDLYDDEDMARCRDAEMIAHDMMGWRKQNQGVWRDESARRELMSEIDPALRDAIAEKTRSCLANFCGIATGQLIIREHNVNDWSRPGFAIRRHYFRFEATGPHFEKLIGNPIDFPEWRIFGWDIFLGDVFARVKSPNLIALELQTVGA